MLRRFVSRRALAPVASLSFAPHAASSFPAAFDVSPPVPWMLHSMRFQHSYKATKKKPSDDVELETAGPPLPPPLVEVYYDGRCPLCMKEMDILMDWDWDRGRVKFTDLHLIPGTDDDVNAAVGGGYTGGRRGLQEMMTGKDLVTGEVFRGVETFRRMYEAVAKPFKGRNKKILPPPVFLARSAKWGVRLTRIPGIKQLADFVYKYWAEKRLKSIEARAKSGEVGACVDGSCDLYPKIDKKGQEKSKRTATFAKTFPARTR